MKTALRAIGYTLAAAGGLAAFLAVWFGVVIGVAEMAVMAGAAGEWAPLYGLGAWGVIACIALGTGAALAERERAS